jgi:hypothetical protein
MSSRFRWTFFRAGGFDQVKLDSGQALLNIEDLDQKLWVALACPTVGLEIDRRTLELIDSDRDGRVRAPELIQAVKFAGKFLNDPDELLKGRSALPLNAIKRDRPEAVALFEAAEQILRNLDKSGATEISIEDLADPVKVFDDAPFNGDGIITEVAASNDSERTAILEMIECIGSETDRSGKPGIGLAQVESFFAELRAYDSWLAEAVSSNKIWILGREKTMAAGSAVAKIRSKIDDYFARCRLAAFDPRIVQILNRKEDEYLEVAARDLSLSAEEVAGFPLAQIIAGRALPLTGVVNPAFSESLETLRNDAITPLIGLRDELTELEWRRLVAELAPFDAWLSAKQGTKVEKLGEERIAALLASGVEDRLRNLIKQDLALEEQAKSIENVERLVRYYRDLYLLCTNFVNFRDFYDGSDPAVFQCGTLYLDQRACRLCLRVQDPATHATMAGLAGAYLVYAECKRPSSNEKMNIVAAFTAGDSDNLMVGRNGLFYDRAGRDWDATITKIIDNPIGIRQAFWAPYKKFVRLIEEQVAKRAAVADSESQTSLGSAATGLANADKSKAAEPTKKIDVGSVAALGVAVGAIGGFLTALVGYITGILQLGILATVAALIGVVILISTPSVVLAYLTLRKRNLGPILDANGWAVNANAKINVAFGASLTSVAKLPPLARRDSQERFVDHGLPWKRYVLLFTVIVVAYRWCDGSWDKYVPTHLRAKTLVGKWVNHSTGNTIGSKAITKP